ncbi:hypothetical protein HNP49_002115 [Pseudomonas fluvialis]|uniref:KOW domain-containing protein n=1 Tax=Pseudomonas fluvialis TaxID=1793966 RepID=A0A7X0BSP3_9PSED|nr:hypothetical protein [Pseudomonas fluvialis]
MESVQLNQAFLSHTPISGVAYQHNDFVLVVSGAHAGSKGSLASLISLSPEPTFILELESGFDVEIKKSELAYAVS